jgi:probable F420-dependent oxidoreductase
MPDQRWGLTIPFTEQPLREELALYQEAEALGYTDLWTIEVNAQDAWTPLALAAAVTKTARLGTAIVSTYTRTPSVIAMHAASLDEAAPGRVCLGLGSSSVIIVQDWNGIPFEKPLQKVRDVVTVLRPMLAGEKVTAQLATLSVNGFRLARPPAHPVPIYLGALRENMLRLAGELADGVILNFLGPHDVAKPIAVVREAARQAGRNPQDVEITARIFVFASDDRQGALAAATRFLTGYLTVPTYAKFHEWLGRGAALKPMHDAWAAGDRRGALAAFPDEVAAEIAVVGTVDECRARIELYRQNGVDVPIIALIGTPNDPPGHLAAMMRALAPSATGR